ncbi:MAG: YihA family ribosome biogenesis GTP-binding protein [Ignavibacteriaceae bacterium]|nr:YihA family ribosome biogenesis GTP-binding protein [Ignavibacteriaceae bacterium]
MKIELFKTVFTLKDLPPPGKQELVLCGRSNVGKSSFINSLFRVKGLAKVSATPGKTRSLNFYSLEGKDYIVDLPGYGYAKASAEERASWNKLILGYLGAGRDIRAVIMIVDSRLEPQKSDLELFDFFSERGYSSILILNKSDKLNQKSRAGAVKNFASAFPVFKQNESMFFYSSVNGEGRDSVLKAIKIILK